MSNIKKKFIGVLAALLCAVLIISTLILYSPKSKTANADRAYAEYFNIINTEDRDLWQNGYNMFDKGSLQNLFYALSGEPDANYKTIEKMVYPYADAGDYDSAIYNWTVYDLACVEHKAKAGESESQFIEGSPICVWFGGFKWDVVYMTATRKDGKANPDNAGDIFLTLWQASDDPNLLTSRRFSFFSSGTVSTYPSNMYSTSNVRVNELNAGGYAASGTTSLRGKTEQNPEHPFAHLTMKNPVNGHDSVIDYIVQPKDVAYQETVSAGGRASGFSYNCPNDAYGTPSGKWYQSTYNYTNKGRTAAAYDEETGRYLTAYDDWKYDYLWVPALAETGNSGSGSASTSGWWRTYIQQRCAYSQLTWLRSAPYDATRVHSLNTSGTTPSGSSAAQPTQYLTVRPAIHLNLTKAAQNAGDYIPPAPEKPTEEELTKTVTYNGLEQSFDLTELEIYDQLEFGTSANFDDGILSATNAGTYTVTATPTAGRWKGGGTADPVTFTLNIEKAKFTVDYTDSGVGDTFAKSVELIYNSSGYTLEVPRNDITTGDAEGATTPTEYEIEYKYTYSATLLSSPPQPSTAWQEAAPQGDNVGYYYIWFKITDPTGNHEDYDGYFEVQIAQLILYVTFEPSWPGFGGFTYGEAEHTSQGLYDQFSLHIDNVKNQEGEDALSEFNPTDFEFYLIDKNGAKQPYETILNAGTYRLRATSLNKNVIIRYGAYQSETSNPPTYIINPKPIELTIADGGHEYGKAPSSITVILTYGGENPFVGDDNADSLGTINYTFTSDGNQTPQPISALKTQPNGTYTVTAANGVYGNYTVTFTAGTYTIGAHTSHIFPDTWEHVDGTTKHSHTCTFTGCEATQEEECGVQGQHVDPTCTEYGYYEYDCPKCGTYTVQGDSPDDEPKGHSYGDGWEHDEDYHWHECSVCNEHEEDIEHDYNRDTWQKDGDYHWHECECGVHEEDIAHVWEEGVPDYSAGTRTDTCRDCQQTKVETVARWLTKPHADDLEATYNAEDHTVTVEDFDADKMDFVASYGSAFEHGVFKAKFAADAAYTLTITIKAEYGSIYSSFDGGDTEVVIRIKINRADLTITANDASVEYGEAAPAYTATLSGVMPQDEAEMRQALVFLCDYAAGSPVGGYDIMIQYFNTNYNIDLKEGNLEVNPKDITLKIANSGHTYGEAPKTEFELVDAYGELLSGDSVSDITGVVFVIKDSGREITLTTTTAKGEYAITAEGGVFGNYNVTFEDGEYIVSGAEIIVRKGSNEWFDEQVDGGAEGNYEISLQKKDDDGNYEYIITVDGCEVVVTFYPSILSAGSSFRPDDSQFTSNTAPVIPRDFGEGRYVIWYKITAENHETLYGTWRIEIAARNDYIIVIFNKSYKVRYDSFYTAEAIKAELLNPANGYITIESEDNLTLEQFAAKVDLIISRKHANIYGNQNVGWYDFRFVITDPDETRSIIYRRDNDDFDSNEDTFIIEQAELSVQWGSMIYNWSEGGVYDIVAQLVGHTNYKEAGVLSLGFIIKNELGEIVSEITEAGSYSIEAVLVGDIYGNFTLKNVSGVLVVKAPAEANIPAASSPATSMDSIGGAPWWVWMLAVIGVLIIIMAVIVAILLVKNHDKAAETTVQTVEKTVEVPVEKTVNKTVVVHDVKYVDEGGFSDPYDGAELK